MHLLPSGILGISWALWLWETYLDYRQYKVYLKTDKVPDIFKDQIDHDTFKRSKSYSIDKARMSFITSIFNQFQSTMIICFYLIPYFWNLSRDIMVDQLGFTASKSLEWQVFQSLVFTVLTTSITTLINMPLTIYQTFVIEQRHGFNKQTALFFAWDKTKAFVLTLVITLPLVAAMINIVHYGGRYFPIILWIFCFVVVLLLTFFHGDIAALFDKFIPLPTGELRERIEAMAGKLKFPLSNIYIIEGSKRSSHSNAYQSGSFSKKHIVIYDTLIQNFESRFKTDDKKASDTTCNSESTKGCDDDEIVAVLCHEIGHWYHCHLWKLLAVVETNYFMIFMLFSYFYRNPDFYAAFGFTNEMPVLIGFTLLTMVLTPYNALTGFLMIKIQRLFEYQSDNFAKQQGMAAQLKTALVKLQSDNLSFPVYDALYSSYNHSHPTVPERHKALDKTD